MEYLSMKNGIGIHGFLLRAELIIMQNSYEKTNTKMETAVSFFVLN